MKKGTAIWSQACYKKAQDLEIPWLNFTLGIIMNKTLISTPIKSPQQLLCLKEKFIKESQKEEVKDKLEPTRKDAEKILEEKYQIKKVAKLLQKRF